MPQPFNRRTWSVFPLRSLVEEVSQSLADLCRERAIETAIDIPANLKIAADRELYRGAVERLWRGAIAAMPHGGQLTATSAAGRDGVELEIADTGPALPDDARRHPWDPSALARRPGASAWDLTAVRHVAELHGGTVSAANCPDGGVAFTLRIPAPVALEAAA